MSIGMQIFYHTINTMVTNFYYACRIYVLSDVVDHKKHIARTAFIYAVVALATTIMTETCVPVIIKGPVEMVLTVTLYRLLLTEETAAVALYYCYFDLSIVLQEDIIIFVCKLNHINPWVDVGRGVQLGKAQVILISSLFQLILAIILKRVLKSASEILSEKEIWVLVFVGSFFFAVDETVKQLFYRFIESTYLLVGIILIVGSTVVYTMLYVIFIKFLHLKQKKREEQFKLEAMERQFAYYRDKQKDEEQVRSVYHDMKNHLLVLEHQIHSPEAAEMVEKLQRKMESYADYVHTGNDFLDVIIKDKTRVAREKQIDFSVAIDWYGLDFIEPLDISTIFGNGIDNAIEASGKLPEGQGVILVKVGRMQDSLSIFMENNCQEEDIGNQGRAQSRKRTGKGEGQFYGFGISNMEQVVGKYGGQLITTCEAGKFTLSIMLPIPRADGGEKLRRRQKGDCNDVNRDEDILRCH